MLSKIIGNSGQQQYAGDNLVIVFSTFISSQKTTITAYRIEQNEWGRSIILNFAVLIFLLSKSH